MAGELSWAQNCVRKIGDSVRAGRDDEVKGCEGNGFAAGPGVYVCDNPFTSHDYGSTVLVMRTKPGDRNVANTSGTVAQASGGVDREITGNGAYDAIFYDFRANDFGGYALAVRQPGLLDGAQTYAVKVPSGDPKELHFHEAFACTPQAGVKDVLTHWGDQLDFLAITFDSFRDPAGKNFEKAPGQMNDAALVAALASNVVAVPDADLQAKIKLLTGKSAELKDALSNDSCAEAEHTSPRMCLAYELYDSIVGNMGTNNNPTHAWSLGALKSALQGLGILSAAQATQYKDRASLMKFLAQRFTTDPHQYQRAQEAFGCMKAVKAQLQDGNLSQWPGGNAGGSPDAPAAAAPGAGQSAQ